MLTYSTAVWKIVHNILVGMIADALEGELADNIVLSSIATVVISKALRHTDNIHRMETKKENTYTKH